MATIMLALIDSCSKKDWDGVYFFTFMIDLITVAAVAEIITK